MPDFDFDAFNHEEGAEEGAIINPIENTAENTQEVVSAEAVQPAIPAEPAPVISADSKSEEVDKW